ncbi:molybdopterin molybdotransferase MoeA [Thalassotalea sp. PLHSN55]|uniref:molybdopterin molybdotransferase MoeA n=1 Tax=Thalassotalea sp. PLHSN55 TaxID=3435888 RepID=UPI003F8477A4
MSDCCSAPGLKPFEDALAQMLAEIKPVSECESINIETALDRVLSEDIYSPINVPPHNNSAMDGYAFRIADRANTERLTLVGRSMAGQPFTGSCGKNECVRIMTGAKMPADCDTVEMQENCQVEGDTVHFLSLRKEGDNVRCAGEDIAKGHLLFAKGRKLSTIDIGMLASLGVATVTVVRKLKVALIATGDELKQPGMALTDGDIFESNSHTLSGMLQRLNVDVINFGIIEDDKAAIQAAFEQADKNADAVISSGGVSVGDADYTKEVLDELGEIGFWKIAMKPGKPFAFGKLPNSYFFGLPGNPVSAVVTAHLLAIPALIKMQNCHDYQPVKLKVKTETALKKGPGRMDFQRGVLSVNPQGETVVHSTGSQGSGILSSMAIANCYIVLPACQGKVCAGEMVDVQLFDHYLR